MSRINFKSWVENKLENILPNTDIQKATNEDFVEIITKDRDFARFQFDKLDKRKISEIIEEEAESKVKKLKKEKHEELEDTFFQSVVVQFPVTIELKSMNDIKNAIHKKLDTILLKYDENLQGVIMSFKNLKIVSKSGNISYNPTDPGLSFTVEVEFIVFSPRPGQTLKGIVTHVEKDFVSLTVFGIFHAQISRKNLSKKAKENDEITFKIFRIDQSYDKFIEIEGYVPK